MSGWILSMKVLLISAGVVSLAVGLRFSLPVAVNGIPAVWSVFLSWLKPPYLYLIINGIIITIAASSRFHHSQSSETPAPAVRSEHLISVKAPPPEIFESFVAPPDVTTVVEAMPPPPAAEVVMMPESEDAVVELRPVMVNGLTVDIEPEEETAVGDEDRDVFVESTVDIEPEKETAVGDEDRDVFVESTFEYNDTPPAPEETISPELQLESLFPAREKPLVTSRFAHRKPNRTNPEGARALRVARAKKHDTLESTWKMITEGRHVPLTRHLKKPETSEHHHTAAAATDHHVPKPETFKERAAAKILGKEPSLGQDELNRRVEAFIKKFNEEMRMQRQESLNQYMEMINRGV